MKFRKPSKSVILRPQAEESTNRSFALLRMTQGTLRKNLKWMGLVLLFTGCTVKAVGDPNRPITINANVVVDIRGLKQTASSIEDRVAKGG